MSQLRQRKKDKGGVRVSSHFRAPKQESEAAKRLGGEIVKGSGSGFEKGDVRVKGVMRLEAKCTMKKSFTLQREMISKIERAALSAGEGELPAMIIEFITEDGKPLHEVAVVPTWVLDVIAKGEQ